MRSEIAIKVENLSKCYQIYDKPIDRLLQILARGRKQYFREYWALRKVSFELKKGETVGIIGRNGSGKSTLLQMICGTINPTSGSIKTQGRIAALLEMGSGFNPEFTGRENIYMNAAVLGLTKEETDTRFDNIVSFADIGDFIEQPVKTYSSGMAIRLAFAVQTQVDPDIIIVDEALAVGDAMFQSKCFNHLKRLKDSGTSILLVTHSSEQIVTHCSHALLLDNGVAIKSGKPLYVVNCYMNLLFGKKQEVLNKSKVINQEVVPSSYTNVLSYSADNFSTHPGYNQYEYRWGDGKAVILDFYLSADNQPYPLSVCTGQVIKLSITLKFIENLIRPILGITIKTKEGLTVSGVNSETLNIDKFKSLGQQGSIIFAEAEFYCRLGTGDYLISLGIATLQGDDVIPHDRRYDAIHLQVISNTHFFGQVDLDIKLFAQEVVL